MNIVTIDTSDGTLRRYRCGTKFRLTHRAEPKDGPDMLHTKLIEEFRRNPPDDFKIEPPPNDPDLPPANVAEVANDAEITSATASCGGI